MTDDDLMAAVWADPDCPVTLAGADSEYPWLPPIPYPRERATIPAGERPEVWRVPCRCSTLKSAKAWHDVPTVVRRNPRSPVEMRPRVWLVNDPVSPESVLVYLGQCQDCGRIYWAVAR